MCLSGAHYSIDDIEDMNTLYTYGCSFTEDLHQLPEHTPRIEYANKYCGGIYKNWNEILAEKLGFDLVNYASTSASDKFHFRLGNGNEDILEALSLSCDRFKKGDIVIVQLSYLERLRYCNNSNEIVTFLPSSLDLNYKKFNYLIDFCYNRGNDIFVKPLINLLNPYIRLSKEIGFKFYLWGIDDLVQEKVLKMNHPNWLFDKNINHMMSGLDIETETNNKIKDGHWGKPAQQIFSDLVFNIINKHNTI